MIFVNKHSRMNFMREHCELPVPAKQKVRLPLSRKADARIRDIITNAVEVDGTVRVKLAHAHALAHAVEGGAPHTVAAEQPLVRGEKVPHDGVCEDARGKHPLPRLDELPLFAERSPARGGDRLPANEVPPYLLACAAVLQKGLVQPLGAVEIEERSRHVEASIARHAVRDELLYILEGNGKHRDENVRVLAVLQRAP